MKLTKVGTMTTRTVAEICHKLNVELAFVAVCRCPRRVTRFAYVGNLTDFIQIAEWIRKHRSRNRR